MAFTLANSSGSVLWVSHIPVWSIRDASADSLVYPLFVFWGLKEKLHRGESCAVRLIVQIEAQR